MNRREGRRSWKELTVEDFRRYYGENFAEGAGRRKVKEDDGGFYSAVQRRGLLDEVFPKKWRSKWDGFTVDDFRKYREENLSGMSRTEVKNEDNHFYHTVRRKGLLDEVLPKREARQWNELTVEVLKKYCQENFSGMSRTEIQKADASFYCTLTRRGIVEEVLPASKRRDYQDWDVEDFREYYEENYAGMSRGEVQKIDGGFSNALRARGIADEVMPNPKLVQFRGWGAKMFKQHYEEHFSGMTPSEVDKEDPGFYNAVRTRGLSGEIFLIRKRRDYNGWELRDFQDFYEKHFAGLCRSEVQAKDIGFYLQVTRKGFTKDVFPERIKGRWEEFDLDDLSDYYQRKHKGKSRSKVQGDDEPFYTTVKKRGLLDAVFPRSQQSKPKGYWQDFNNVRSELEQIVEELGKFPSSAEIRQKKSTLIYAIEKYHGGLIKIKIKLGYADEELDVLKQIVEEYTK